MIQKIKKKLIILASVLTLVAPVALATPAYAQDIQSDINENLRCGSNAEFTGTDPSTGEPKCAEIKAGQPSDLTTKVKKILNVLSVVVGVVAIIMIIFGGFRYVASGGKQESVTAAKNTLLYAIVGLIIVALAQAIVQFVLRGTA